MKWVTTTKRVDLETGEILSESQTQDYIKIKSYFKTTQHKTYYHKEYIVEYKKTKNQKLCQTKMF